MFESTWAFGDVLFGIKRYFMMYCVVNSETPSAGSLDVFNADMKWGALLAETFHPKKAKLGLDWILGFRPYNEGNFVKNHKQWLVLRLPIK